MITEDYVSFEVAKLLKEKGFDEDVLITDWWYDANGISYKRGNYSYSGAPLYNKETCFNCPTIQLAMKWLREVHKLYVSVIPAPLNWEHQDIQDGWGCEVTHLSDLSYDSDYEFFQKKYQIYESACEAAIKYCLENLI